MIDRFFTGLAGIRLIFIGLTLIGLTFIGLTLIGLWLGGDKEPLTCAQPIVGADGLRIGQLKFARRDAGLVGDNAPGIADFDGIIITTGLDIILGLYFDTFFCIEQRWICNGECTEYKCDYHRGQHEGAARASATFLRLLAD